jgi:DNA-directed RNA polymerase specialized sigma24 family protein
MTSRRNDKEGPSRVPGAGEAETESRFAALSDAQLVAALRRGELEVLGEFVFRFGRVVMGQARHFGIPSDERRAWAKELLYDVALRIGKPGTRVPEHIRAFLITAAHHKLVSELRADRRWGQQEDSIDAPPRPLDEQGLEGGCSEYSRRASGALGQESPPLSPLLQRLVNLVEEGLTAEEHRLLQLVLSDTPHREIARLFSISRSGVTHRVNRLFHRLQEAAKCHAFHASPRERAQLRRVLPPDFFKDTDQQAAG